MFAALTGFHWFNGFFSGKGVVINAKNAGPTDLGTQRAASSFLIATLGIVSLLGFSQVVKNFVDGVFLKA